MTHRVSGGRFLAQMINAERHMTQEVERLKAEGWTVVGDYCYKEESRG